ncbi:MAG TPA: glycerol-3-phosphate dehydrogenase [Dehalococcoidia bacterium]
MEADPRRADYDVVVVGGGINGAGIALALAGAGYAVLLLERHDFGSGTTSRSTKLIHGGLRYLEHGEFGLVFESLRERQVLLGMVPHLVRPLTFVLPVRRGDRRPPWKIRLGLLLYDLLSLRKSLRWHRRLSPAELARLEPELARDALRGAFSYQDAQVVYPERLAVENVLAARDQGAEVRNYAEVTALLAGDGRVRGVRFRQRTPGAAGAEREATARLVVNAAGPWVDRVLARSPAPAARRIGGTKGSHVVVDFHGHGPRHAVYAQARSDGRPFFVVPWRRWHLVGTTDTRFDGDPDEARATPEEVDYLLSEANLLFPAARLGQADVLYTYAGVRPLPYTESGPEAAITRRHLIHDHAGEGLEGLLSIVGGKLTTYRSLAAQVLRAAERKLGPAGPRPAAGLPPDLADVPSAGEVRELAERYGLERDSLQMLVDLYGGRFRAVLDLAEARPQLRARFCPGNPDIAAELVYAVEREEAQTLADVLLRRTGVGWSACRGQDCAEAAAAVLVRHGLWEPDRAGEEVERYRREILRVLPRPDEAPVSEAAP